MTGDHTDTSYQVVPIFDQEDRAALLVYERDVVLKRRIVKSPRSPTASFHRPPVGLSPKSRRRLRHELRNGPAYSWFLTLSYPCGGAPSDGKTAQSHLRKMVRHLKKRGCFGIWKLEFTGPPWHAPHFHLLLEGPCNSRDLLSLWSASVGLPPSRAMVCLEPVTDRSGLDRYMMKSVTVPGSFSDCGHLWGYVCKAKARASPTFVLEGSPSEIAPVDRVLRKVAKSKKQRIKGGGVAGQTYFDTSSVIARVKH